MIKLKSKSDVIEWYWPDYLKMCMKSRDSKNPLYWQEPTLGGFWLWYITDGAMGLKHRGLFYTKDEIEYS